jgi:quercetin dioxygenase-like cupin family protein
MNYSRRDLSLLLPALAAATAAAQDSNKQDSNKQHSTKQDSTKLLSTKIFQYEDLPVKVNGQNQARAVLNGETHQGYAIEMHMTELGPGQAPHAPHKHVHEEMLMLQTGMLETTVNGQTSTLTAGSIAYIASNDLHGWRNPGATPAQYFVIAFGGSA